MAGEVAAIAGIVDSGVVLESARGSITLLDRYNPTQLSEGTSSISDGGHAVTLHESEANLKDSVHDLVVHAISFPIL